MNERFYVPKYQRGYRWKEKQVTDLLNDIDRFAPCNDAGKNTWYCLQPLVVKNDDNGQFHLIDGQQRLTTIKLILHYLNQQYVESKRKTIFSIEYETRGKDEAWIKSLDDEKSYKENIDFSHIYDAYKTIEQWFESKGNSYDTFKFSSKLLTDCKFIWYDIAQNEQNNDKEEDVFIRLNDGKIPLTNSELIKALFLNSSNFAKDKNEEEIRLRQFEISTQWDTIEQELSDNEFWYFINGKENEIHPRIEYIFDLIAEKSTDKDDKYSTFRFFQEKFDENENQKGDKLEFVKKEWENILNTYLIFKEWFNDKYYYHLTGYLLCMNKVTDLLAKYKKSDKDTFKTHLSAEVTNTINWNGQDEIKYGDKRVNKILLLHNVIAMQKQQNETARFSFCHYIGTKNEKGWDIEHIQARAEKSPEKEEHRKAWLEEMKDVIKGNDELQKEVKNFADYTKDDAFNELVEKVNQYFEKNSDMTDYNENLLSNLVLLDAGTNRGYGNEFYPVKRKTILEKDQNGTFIPVCTKKVFLKYYTNDVSTMTFWTAIDREAYLNDIKTVLENYLKK